MISEVFLDLLGWSQSSGSVSQARLSQTKSKRVRVPDVPRVLKCWDREMKSNERICEYQLLARLCILRE